jgi:release factor glutamine methyltransferase
MARMSATLRQLVASARARLEVSGIESNEAGMDASLLARHQLGWDLAHLIAHETDPPPAGFAAVYEALIARRADREPISVILGAREFRGLDFEVTPAVLAPRPETEIIIEAALERLATPSGQPVPGTPSGQDFSPALLVDVGTGSGCLAVCLALEFPDARVVATDISPAALEVAARNVARHRVGGRVTLVHASLLDGVGGPASLIVSNPPYVPSSDIASLPPEVRDWEPRSALDGGPDGLDIARALLADAPRVLAPGGWLIMEIGFGQEDGIREAVSRSALELVEIRRDLQGVPRTVVAALGPKP